tara:strand:- start:6307 stop:6708 length:402 start_codon:yes stop_codon:yes gene_type:complete
MLNTLAFINRLQELMTQKQLSAAAFASKIGVQRSSVSHILAQRNKPSLEFILKIHDAFEEIDLTWLLLGQKKTENNKFLKLESETVDEFISKPIESDSGSSEIKVFPKLINSDIETVITLYKDGTFKIYSPKS